jgi:hypothetical protein
MTSHRVLTLSGVIALSAILPSVSQGQVMSDRDFEILRMMSTPFGALPPIVLPMPASRNHNYFIGRLQGAQRRSPTGINLRSVGAGLDLQYLGGSIFGLTGGYQERDCSGVADCSGGHPFFGGRAQINLMTGGSAMAGLLKDNSTTSTFGTELGVGYAPNVQPGKSACTIDFGVPYSVAKRRQRPRLVAYVTPGIVWDMSCRSSGPATKKSYFTGFGLGLQQLGNRSLDLYLGVQKVYRADVGTQVGLSISYVRLP